MANSLITRCPKCSTAFRVSDDVLSMAKGKVRCGQCFTIFDARKLEDNKTEVKKSKSKDAFAPTQKSELKPASEEAKKRNQEAQYKARVELQQNTAQPSPDNTRKTSNTTSEKELAPWEVELEKVEAALSSKPTLNQSKSTSHQSKPTLHQSKAPTKPDTPPASKTKAEPTVSSQQPDYMTALQSLAQNASEQTSPENNTNQHSILEQLSAQESLAPLLEDHLPSDEQKNTHPWLWFLALVLGLVLLASQAAVHFFDQGSRSAKFRTVYKTICSYYDCVLPKFEDVSTITIQHVRVQSHPSIKNTLLVNAIITNVSGFSQSMPKIALEFFDLNGSPVAARLFSPTDYLHKDFLDITYMPPNTPIHVVIPIQDPGARAVTHQLKAYPTDTRSY